MLYHTVLYSSSAAFLIYTSLITFQVKIEQMADLLPSAKVIVLLRDPIIRAIAEFNGNCKNGEYIRLIKPILIPYLSPKIRTNHSTKKKQQKVDNGHDNNNSNSNDNIGNSLKGNIKMKKKETVTIGERRLEKTNEEKEKVERMFFLPEHSVMRMSSLQFLLGVSSASFYTASASSLHNTTHNTHNRHNNSTTIDRIKSLSGGRHTSTSTSTSAPPFSSSFIFTTFLTSLASKESSSSRTGKTFFPLPPIDGYTVSLMWKINRNVLESSFRILSSPCTTEDFHDFYFGHENENGNKNENMNSEIEIETDSSGSEIQGEEKERGRERGRGKGGGGREKLFPSKNVLPLKQPRYHADPGPSHSMSIPTPSSSSTTTTSSSISSTSTSPHKLSNTIIKETNNPSAGSKKNLQNKPEILGISAEQSSKLNIRNDIDSNIDSKNSKSHNDDKSDVNDDSKHRTLLISKDKNSENSKIGIHKKENMKIQDNLIRNTSKGKKAFQNKFEKDLGQERIASDNQIKTHTSTPTHTDTHTDETFTDSLSTSGILKTKGLRSLIETSSTSDPGSTPSFSINSTISSSSGSASDSRISSSSIIELNSKHFAAEERSHGHYDVLMKRLMRRYI